MARILATSVRRCSGVRESRRWSAGMGLLQGELPTASSASRPARRLAGCLYLFTTPSESEVTKGVRAQPACEHLKRLSPGCSIEATVANHRGADHAKYPRAGAPAV